MKDDTPRFESFKFPYSNPELLAMGQELAQENRAIYELEQKKKESQSSLTAEIKAANGRAQSLSNRINNGYEVRDVQVLYVMDMPTEGQKTVVRTDLNQEVRVEAMTPDERQRELLFDDPHGA